MLPYQTLISIEKENRIPVYQQLAHQLAGLIQRGVIKPGSFLPASRVMAGTLQLHRKTIVAAYEELSSMDWVVNLPRKGVMVASNLPSIKPRTFKSKVPVNSYGADTGFCFDDMPEIGYATPGKEKFKLVVNDGFPDTRLAPVNEWAQAMRQFLAQPGYAAALSYGSSQGNMHLRRAMVPHLADTRGLSITTDHVLMTRGAQMSIYLAAAMLIKPGDAVIVGSPGYFLAELCFEQLGAKLIRVPVDAGGIDVAAVAALCKTRKIKMLYIIPHHHHPTTVTLSAERRMELLQLIRKYRLAVIEDDYDYDFHYASAPILPLASADHGGNVIYIGSFSKSLALSIRCGFMIAPAGFIEQATRLRKLIDIRGDNLTEEVMAMLLQNGTVDRHIKKTNKLYSERRDVLCRELESHLGDAVEFTKPNGGMAVWVRFKKKYPLKVLGAKAAKKGLLINSDLPYSYGKEPTNGLRMGFASLNTAELKETVQILQSCL
ncbi:MocR-like pyridoxine biosynthesis transcription factor PdxR [Deminuibacter soli]|uniref:PLP-dependent aminotransferase family protein n=1 Tax=Deminuibacter soli TaxID=2291815 RepID=A0A3E1NNJ5_9BACT|nr:PLP-dependent aminotransferase family protein [Deminuibacter soli]RFM29467.1 PLP-dependent aminotransferase family protein [Deminuibacter soli]